MLKKKRTVSPLISYFWGKTKNLLCPVQTIKSVCKISRFFYLMWLFDSAFIKHRKSITN